MHEDRRLEIEMYSSIRLERLEIWRFYHGKWFYFNRIIEISGGGMLYGIWTMWKSHRCIRRSAGPGDFATQRSRVPDHFLALIKYLPIEWRGFGLPSDTLGNVFVNRNLLG
jgi:hypothetical protein